MTMQIDYAADAAFMAEDSGVSVVFGVQTTKGWLDVEDVDVPDGTGLVMVVRKNVLRIRTGSLTGLKADVALTVNGQARHLRHAEVEGDGVVTRLILAED